MKTLVLIPEKKTEITISYMAAPGADQSKMPFFHIPQCIEKICSHQNVSVDMVLSKSRKKEIVLLRMILVDIVFKYYLVANRTLLSHYFGKDDHSLMVHYLNRIQGAFDIKDKMVMDKYNECYNVVVEDLRRNRINFPDKMRLKE